MGKKIGCIIGAVVAVAVVGGGIFGLKQIASSVNLSGETYLSGKVMKKDLSSYVNVAGTVASSSMTSVTAEVDQKITKINVKVGDAVKKGDILCVFDSTSLQESLDRLENSAEQTQGAEDYHDHILQRNLEQAQADRLDAIRRAQDLVDQAANIRDNIRNTFNNTKAMYEAVNAQLAASTDPAENYALNEQANELAAQLNALGERLAEAERSVSSARESYNSAVKAADSAVQAAQDAIDASQYSKDDNSTASQIKKLKEQIEKCTVRAAADGVVTALNATEGSIPANPVLMTIENTAKLIVRGKVNESDVLKVQEGMSCEIRSSATGDDILKGELTRIERIVSSASLGAADTGYNVEISIDEKDCPLLIGMSASAKIILDKVEDVLCVPYDSVFGGENEGYFVYVGVPVDAGNVKLEKHTVEKGFEGDYYTEIVGSDLTEDAIVLTRNNGLPMEDGMVIPTPNEKKQNN